MACNTIIERNIVSYQCTLDADHDGPHMAPEDARSVREREQWDAERRQLDSGLAEFQGVPQTTAQRYTENPTPVPQTRQQIAEAQQAQATRQTPRPNVLAANDDLIKAGVMHNPYDPLCQRRDPREARLWGERCYICNVASSPVAPADESNEVQQPTKQRPGDQPIPTPTGGEYVQDRILRKARAVLQQGGMTEQQFAVIERTMEESKRVGTERYGTPLQIFNGRDALQDLAEEARDLMVYANQLMMAREADRATLIGVFTDAMHAQWMTWADQGVQHTPREFCEGLAQIAVDTLLKATGPMLE